MVFRSKYTSTTKTQNGVKTEYLLGGSAIYGERKLNATTGAELSRQYYLFGNSGELVGLWYNNAYYFYVKNVQGDITGIVDSSGNLVVEYQYDEWGKLLSTSGSMASTLGKDNPFRYRGYYYDVESGLYYLQSRYYDPTVRRFVNADIVAGMIGSLDNNNVYAYCGNDPVNRGDVSGEFWDELWDEVRKTAQNIGRAVLSVFGAGSTVEQETSLNYASPPAPFPIRYETSTTTSTVISSSGDSSKPISVYASSVNGSFAQSSVGLKINAGGVKANVSLGLSDIGISLGYEKDQKAYNLKLSASLREFKANLKWNDTTQIDENTSETVSSGLAVDGTFIGAVLIFLYTGNISQSPSPAYG